MKKIDFTTFDFKSLIKKGTVGTMYEKNPPVRKFRDTVTFYKDGKIHFIRYCYGESAGEVAEMWSKAPLGKNGEIIWDYDSCPYSKKDEAPLAVFATDDDGAIYFDDMPYSWSRKKELVTDPANGYSRLKGFFMK